MGCKTRLNQMVTKPQHVLLLIDTFYLIYNNQCIPFRFHNEVFIPNASDE